ncbi:hypothetical protein [Chitinivorax sp. B]|uniref:hypothetical protein n=1 Tax=Chitinivorax sp. B TaxID=2502235 RepID=UPI0010F71FDF|nr:hypothetical protein [Chitinivorax sp. B]
MDKISQLEIDTRGIDSRFGLIQLSNFSRPVTNLAADSLEALARYRFILPPEADRQVKLEAQLENSLTISHPSGGITLTDWKHYRSEWQTLQRLDKVEFAGPRFADGEEGRFPSVTTKEIHQILNKHPERSESVLRQAENCTTAMTFPCSVNASLVRVRLMYRQGNDWSILHEIRFDLPPP